MTLVEREALILVCTECNTEFKFNSIQYKCPECDGILLIKTDLNGIKKIYSKKKDFKTFWEYNFAFPHINEDFIVTLGEGITPCRPSIKKLYGIENLYFKDETQNPTNSFKDRAAALLISHARSWNYQKVVCASNGNQGASIAAYTSLEGMECVNIIPEELDVGKHAQMIAYQSLIKEKGKIVDETIKEALKKRYKDYYQCTPEFNPLTIEGQKTIAYELSTQIKDLDWIVIPMGSGGLLVSIWKGYKDLIEAGLLQKIPRFIGVQSKASAPIVNTYNEEEKNNDKRSEKSQALGIFVKEPLYQNLAIKALTESNGIALAIPESLMLRSAADLARNEGIFAEPASALTVAALNVLMQEKRKKIQPHQKIACIITGSGLKAPHVLDAISSRAKTSGMGGILSTKLEILSQISISKNEGIYGSQLRDFFGTISLAAIYQHLKDLESKNLITNKKKGKNVFYYITERGERVLKALEELISLL